MTILTPITADTFGVEVALAYATADNFTTRPIYHTDAECFLNPEAANLLHKAVAITQPLGLRLRVLDAFRPAEAQWILWNHWPDPNFIADPRRGSPHSMGAAVDVTLVDAISGVALDMGTPFDDFTPQAHHGNLDVSVEAQRNRHLLMGIMTTAGWDFYRHEWWHYQLFSPRSRYPVLSNSVLGPQGMMP